MRKAGIIAAILMAGGGPAQAQPADQAPALLSAVQHTGGRAAPVVRVGMMERRAPVTRGQIAVCANLAALRALDAKAVGAPYAAQDRILDMTFVLCMAGPQTAD